MKRYFTWGPQWGYSWPIKFMRGEDEYGWRTLGVVTWAGSFFLRTHRCWDKDCSDARAEYWQDVRRYELEEM